MKKLKALIIAGLLSCGVTSQAADITTTLFPITDLASVSTQTVDVAASEAIEVESILTKNRLLREVFIEVETVMFGPYVFNEEAGRWERGQANTGRAWGFNSGIDNKLIIAGPAKLHIVSFGGIGDSGHVAVTLKKTQVTPPPTPASSTLTQAIPVVIPTDAEGPIEIILESSTDMITWVRANPGTYGAETEKRFFRVRGVQAAK